MKTFRFLAVAMISAGLLHTPAARAVSAAVAKPLKEASDLLRAGKAKDALAKLGGVTAAGPDDQYLIARIRGAAYQKLGDNAAAAQALESAFNTGKVPGNEAGPLAESIAYAYSQTHSNAKAQQWIDKAKAAGDNSATLKSLQDYLRNSSGDYAQIARDYAASVQAAEAAGRRPGEDDLLRLADAYRRTNNRAGDLQAKEKLVTYYPANKEYVGVYLSDISSKSGFSSRFALDILRLRLQTGTLTTAADYMELGQLLLQAELPAEAKGVIDKGYTAGVLGTGAEAPRQQRLRDLANKSTTDAKASIAKRTQDATAAKDGNELVALGTELVSLGQYDQGVDMIQQGIAKDTLKRPEDAKLRLGVALLQSGAKNRAKAIQTLKSVQGTDGAADVAHLYIVLGASAQ